MNILGGQEGIVRPTIVKVVFVMLLQCKVSTFPFVFDNCIVGDSLRLWKYFVTHPILTQ